MAKEGLMNPTLRTPGGGSRFTPSPEALESREVMTAGAGNTVAIFPGQVTQAGQPAEVSFTINPANFTFNRGRINLGIDVAAPQTSQVLPAVTAVHNSLGGRVQAMGLGRSGSVRGAATQAIITPLAFRGRQTPVPVTYQVQVTGESQTTGAFLAGLFLPGDANGDGQVGQDDLKDIRSRLGTIAGNQNYSFDADSNRDGVISRTDLILAHRNLGVKSTISPVVTSNLDPASDTGAADRVTTQQVVHFTGIASSGATITYSEINHKTPDVTTTATSDGTYSLNIPLADGANNFHVTVTDTSGQQISGTIAAVSYYPVLTQVAPLQNQ